MWELFNLHGDRAWELERDSLIDRIYKSVRENFLDG